MCFCLCSPNNKMAGLKQISPLLHLRPDFLGVGVGYGDVNIFFELLDLSYSGNTIQNGLIQNNTENEDTHENNLQMKDDEAHHSLQDNIENKYSTETAKIQTHEVVEKDSGGNIIKILPYSFNEKTLKLFSILKDLKVYFKTELYKPKEERLDVDPLIFYCKNLFLKDRKGKYFLVICHEDIIIDLKTLRKDLNACRNFNFATADDMQHILGVEPGGVTPLALMNKSSDEVSMVVSKSLVQEGSVLMFHPMDSSLAIGISMANLLRFLKYFHHQVTFLKY